MSVDGGSTSKYYCSRIEFGSGDDSWTCRDGFRDPRGNVVDIVAATDFRKIITIISIENGGLGGGCPFTER